MATLRFMIVLSASFVVAMAKPTVYEMIEINAKQPRIVKFPELLKQEGKFRCAPQKRSFLTKDLLSLAGITLNTNEHVPLNNIVLYRCDQYSGCCTNDQICTPLGIEPLKLQITVKGVNQANQRTVEIEENNHTICECSVMSPPKR